jgi:glyoxylase-like metal-dependent hydrolase (beta-lactamase superfamily II)
MLIDTGYGIGDLKGFIRTLTDLPLTVYITHGHVDHASGTYPFEDVHMSHYDLELFQKHCNLAFRKQMLENRDLGISESDYLPDRQASFIDIKDKETVDLGGVQVIMIHVPGHTKGTFVPLVKEDRVINYGDASGVGTLICLEGSSTIKEYLESLKNLKTYEDQYDMILRQHGTCTSSLSLLDENIENCELILSHKDDHVPTEFMGNKCFWARKTDEHGHRADGKEGNICYQDDNIE